MQRLPFDLSPAATAGLTARQREILIALEDLVATRSVPVALGAHVSDHTVSLELVARTAPDAELRLTVDPEEIVISSAYEHWHFQSDDSSMGRLYPWPGRDGLEVALAFIEQLLAGRIEVVLDHRILSTRATTWWRDPRGQLQKVSRSNTLLPPFRLGRSVHRLDFGILPG